MKRNKNVLFLLSRFLDGGIDTVLVEYVNAMVKYTNHNVTLVIGIDHRESEVFLDRIDSRVKIIHIISSPLLTIRKRLAHKHKKNPIISTFDEAIANPLRRYITTKRLKELACNNDVVIDFDSCHYSFIKNIKESKTAKKTKYIAFSHFSLSQLMLQNARRTKRTVERWSYYDHIVTISDAMKEEAQKMRPDISGNIVRIYNSVDAENILSKAEEKVIHESFRHPFLLAVERLEESQKDLTTLIKAYSIYEKKHRNEDTPNLYIIGEGKSRQELERLIDRLKLKEKVHLLGFISNPYPWIRQAVALIHSSKFEGLPTILIEALQMGKVIACTDCPTGPSEILNKGKAGILTPVGDALGLANAIETITEDDQTRNELISNAKEHSKLFSSEECINQLQHIL